MHKYVTSMKIVNYQGNFLIHQRKVSSIDEKSESTETAALSDYRFKYCTWTVL